MSLLERLKHFLDTEDISYRKLEEKIGMSNGTISKATKQDKSISHKSIEKILHKFPQLSAEWLMRGNGEMIKTDSSNINLHNGNGNIISGGKIYNISEKAAETQLLNEHHKEAMINTLKEQTCLKDREISHLREIIANKEEIISLLKQQINNSNK